MFWCAKSGTFPDGSLILSRSPAGASYMITRTHFRDISPAVGPKSLEARVSPVWVLDYSDTVREKTQDVSRRRRKQGSITPMA